MNTFKDIGKASMVYFHSLFKDLTYSNIDDLLKVVKTFPICFDQEMNDDLSIEVLREKLEAVLHSFKKARCLAPKG